MMTTAYGYTFGTGASVLFSLAKNKERYYILYKAVEYDIRFNNGIMHVRTEPGFAFDGRSGPSIIDWYVPNLGTLEERIAWHMHDCLGYAQSLNFRDTNLALKCVLRDLAGYGKFKSEIIRKAVGLSRSWYGQPKPEDRWYSNVDKVTTEFYEI